ncbi:MAG: class IV adenylate cyclase [Parachlamydiales bacterium]|jgi:predicted adenylyl cyclase CyaB
MKNIELKISSGSFSPIVKILQKEKAKCEAILNQTDTYYNYPEERLKIREINNKFFEIILYHRPDKKSSKVSNYEVTKLYDQKTKDLVKKVFLGLFGEKVIVKKTRELWLYKNTRIHLDRVDKLGNFLELETVVNKISFTQAQSEHKKVIELLDLEKYPKISKSYSDLLLVKPE